MVQKMLNAHPAMNFKEAYEHAQTLWSKVRAGSAGHRDFVFDSRSDLLTAMGRLPTSGASHAMAASLVHFGFLEKTDDNAYKLTADGRDLLSLDQDSGRWKQAAKELAVKPELYGYLYKKYPEGLPSSIYTQLISQYGDRNINKNNVEGIVKNYRQSLNFAGYSVEANAKDQPANNFDRQPLPGVQDVTLPLANGRNIAISYPMDLTEIEAEKIGVVLKGIAALNKNS